MDNPRLGPCLPIPIDKKLLEEVVEKAKDWALMHGVLSFKDLTPF